MKNESLAYIYSWCVEQGIDTVVLGSDDREYLLVDGKPYFAGTQFYSNPSTGMFLARDKKGTEVFLRNKGFEILPQEFFLFRGESRIRNIANAVASAVSLGFPVVLKPNNGALGTDVYKVENEEELYEKLRLFDTQYGNVNISKFLDLKSEYRMYVYEFKTEIMYKKSLNAIIGDGERTFYELLLINQFKDVKELLLDPTTKYALHDIIPKGREVMLGWKFRLDNKGSSFELLESGALNERQQALSRDAERIAKTMELPLCAVDFYETKEGKFLINEINSGFMIENFIKYGPRNKRKVDALLEKIFRNELSKKKGRASARPSPEGKTTSS